MEKNIDYLEAIAKLDMENLKERRLKLCQNFAIKAARHGRYTNWFQPNTTSSVNPGIPYQKYQTLIARLDRFRDSPIPYLNNLLNEVPFRDGQDSN